MQLTVVSGTNRPGNLSLIVAGICQQMLREKQVEASLLDLQNLPRDLAFGYVGNAIDPAFSDIQALVDRSSHFIFVAPEYNGSIPGILKLFLDACDYPDSFRGKSALLLGIAAGMGGNEKGLCHLDDILTYFGMQVHAERLALPKIRQQLLPDGRFAQAEVESAIRNLIQDYLAAQQEARA